MSEQDSTTFKLLNGDYLLSKKIKRVFVRDFIGKKVYSEGYYEYGKKEGDWLESGTQVTYKRGKRVKTQTP